MSIKKNELMLAGQREDFAARRVSVKGARGEQMNNAACLGKKF